MKKPAVLMLLGGLLLLTLDAHAHCDALDGPVAAAAARALEAKNVNFVLPYAPATAEPELTAAFEQALVVRDRGPEARALADRYFMETAVRLHRAGEKAPYTGLKPAGLDFGPAIPAAEKALESGNLEPLAALLSREMARELTERFEAVHAKKDIVREPTTKAGVAAARERVSAELAFIGYVESIYRGAKGGGHAE